MKAALIEQVQTQFVIRETAVPRITPGEVLIRVKAAGLCHFDKFLVDGFLNTFNINPFPRILGHEVAGIIEQAGAEVAGFRTGDRVGVAKILACGSCYYCQNGEEECCVEFLQHLSCIGVTCDGGFAEYIKVPANRLVHLPPELSFEEAVPFFCAGISVYGALKNAGIRPGMRVAVLGIDGFGSMAVPIAAAMGAEVFAVTLNGHAHAEVEMLGAKSVIAGGNFTSGWRLLEAGGVNAVLTTDIDSREIEAVLLGILPQGTLILTGVSMQPLTILPALLISTQLRIMGSSGSSRQDTEELLDLAVKHNIRPLIETYPLEDINGVFERLRRKEIKFHAVLKP